MINLVVSCESWRETVTVYLQTMRYRTWCYRPQLNAVNFETFVDVYSRCGSE